MSQTKGKKEKENQDRIQLKRKRKKAKYCDGEQRIEQCLKGNQG